MITITYYYQLYSIPYINRVKELELEDRQYEIDKELNEIGQIPRT